MFSRKFVMAAVGPLLVISVVAAQECIYVCNRNAGCMDGPDINCPYCHEMGGDCNPPGVTRASRAYNPSGAVLYLKGPNGTQKVTEQSAICYKQQDCGEGSAQWLYACSYPGREACFYPIIPAPIYCTYCSKVGATTNILTQNATCTGCGS